jgi:hypothetical protein
MGDKALEKYVMDRRLGALFYLFSRLHKMLKAGVMD